MSHQAQTRVIKECLRTYEIACSPACFSSSGTMANRAINGSSKQADIAQVWAFVEEGVSQIMENLQQGMSFTRCMELYTYVPCSNLSTCRTDRLTVASIPSVPKTMRRVSALIQVLSPRVCLTRRFQQHKLTIRRSSFRRGRAI